jgi:cytochrome P450
MPDPTAQKSAGARFIAYMIREKPDLLFKILRNLRPNFAAPNNGPVFITRFRDVQEALERPEIFRVTYAPMMDPSVGPYMLGRDGTTINQRDKGIMRSLMQREDLPRVRGIVAQLAAEALAEAAPMRSIEVVANLSRKVPIQFTGEYFGFPGPDLESMFRWSRATQYDMFHNIDKDPDVHQRNIDAGHEMHAYLSQLIPQRRKELETDPSLDDILSRLLKSRFDDAIGFDEERIMTNMMGTLVGGIETTSQAIVQILDQLFKRPETLEEATAAAQDDDDDKLYRYCWEALRFNPINPFVVRQCAEDYTIASGTLRSTKIKAGRIVLISTRSAMRDGRELCCPNDFCIDRPDYHYMHTGYGLHTCLGDQISQVQIPQIVKQLLKRSNLRPIGEIDFKGGPFPESYTVGFE